MNYPDYAWNRLLYRMGQRAMKQYGTGYGDGREGWEGF